MTSQRSLRTDSQPSSPTGLNSSYPAVVPEEGVLGIEEKWAQRAQMLASQQARSKQGTVASRKQSRGGAGASRQTSTRGATTGAAQKQYGDTNKPNYVNPSHARNPQQTLPSQPQQLVPQSTFPQHPPPVQYPVHQPLPSAPHLQTLPPPPPQPQQPQQQQLLPVAHPSLPVAMPVTQPLSHTVYTEDGRRVSVDINFKMVGAPPVGGEFVPTSGAYDTFARTHDAAPAYAPAHPEPSASYGALTQQNIEAQYGMQRPVATVQADTMHVQSLTSSASTAQFGQPVAPHVTRQPDGVQYPQQQQHPQQTYALPRQPALSHPQEPLPRADRRVAKPSGPAARQGFTKHPKAPPIVPRRAFDQYQQPHQQV